MGRATHRADSWLGRVVLPPANHAAHATCNLWGPDVSPTCGLSPCGALTMAAPWGQVTDVPTMLRTSPGHGAPTSASASVHVSPAPHPSCIPNVWCSHPSCTPSASSSHPSCTPDIWCSHPSHTPSAQCSIPLHPQCTGSIPPAHSMYSSPTSPAPLVHRAPTPPVPQVSGAPTLPVPQMFGALYPTAHPGHSSPMSILHGDMVLPHW